MDALTILALVVVLMVVPTVLLLKILRELEKLRAAGAPSTSPELHAHAHTPMSLAEKEQEYVETIYFPPESDLGMIGFKTIRVPADSVDEFNRFHAANRAQFDSITNHRYDPETGEMRVYFPVRSAVVAREGRRFEASSHGSLSVEGDVDPGALRVIGRRQTAEITGVATNTLEDGILLLASPVEVDHILDGDVLVFDFGERELSGHHDHGGAHHAHGALGARVGCLANHGGVNCTIAFGVGQGRCPFNPAVCMDYNGVFTDCVNYASGWKRYRNFILSDCDYAMGQGQCWNEI